MLPEKSKARNTCERRDNVSSINMRVRLEISDRECDNERAYNVGKRNENWGRQGLWWGNSPPKVPCTTLAYIYMGFIYGRSVYNVIAA